MAKSQKTSYTYGTNNKLAEDFYYTWNSSSSNWQIGLKSQYLYDSNNNLTEWLGQNWDGNIWLNNHKVTYEYDENNNQIEILFQQWDGSVWVNNSMYSFTYVPVTAIGEDYGSVNSYSLSNNYPNPFNPSTKITYTLPERGNVSLKVYDLLGGEVAQLVNGEIEAGSYEIIFNANNLASGVYFYRLQAGSFVQTKKMIIIR